jgi:outer membrane protein OmpA-like peptidoglycan-associated protein
MRLTIRAAATYALLLALTLGGMPGCSSMSKEQKGAIIGAAGGAAGGAVIGRATGSTARGAIIGAVVGGVAGAIIGRKMDQQARELEQNIPGAIVERVGEGIQITFPSGVLFAFDSDVVLGEARRNLNTLADNLEKYDETNLLIVGHTDSKGTDAYNMDLSERRAESAARYLRARGVSRPIQVVGRGEREPVATNDTDEGRSLNRRVEVAIYASPEMVERARREAITQ